MTHQIENDSTGPSSSEVDTLIPSGMRRELLADPEHRRQRLAIEAALFGEATQTLSLGRFRLLQRLGEGGMGTVYAAFDDRLDRKIAVKLIRAGRHDNAQMHERTLREARALARLSHPNVVHVYEVGEVEGQLFVAMEFLAGPTLRAWLDDGTPRGWQTTLSILRQAGHGLAAAHAQGIVHRDFKPHNVMFGADGRVRVLDFGLARLGEGEPRPAIDLGAADEPRDHALTMTGTLLGTPAYMSPEQLAGRPADARSDQFGFCVSLYEALYGQRPFAGTNLAALLDAVSHSRVSDPPAGAAVPTWLRKVVLRGLSSNPEQRFPSMQALLDALADDPALRRRKWVTGAGLLGLLGGVWGLAQVTQPDPEPKQQVCVGASDKLLGVWDDQRRAEVETAILSTKLSYAPDTWARVEPALDRYTEQWVANRTAACEATQTGEQSSELLDLRMACYDRQLSQLRELIDVLTMADATVVQRATNVVVALPERDACADVEALLAEVPPPEDPALAERVAALDQQLLEAKSLEDLGKYAEALTIADAVVAQAEQLDYEPLRARAWHRQGSLQGQAGDAKAAEATLERSYALAVGLGMKENAASAAFSLVFFVGEALARPEDARRWAFHAEPLVRASGRGDFRVWLDINLGLIAMAAAEYEQAREKFESAWAQAEKLGLDDPDAIGALNDLGVALLRLGDHEQARIQTERALELRRSALGPNHPDVGFSLSNLGMILSESGKQAEARVYYEQALAIFESALGPDHEKVATVRGNLGNVLLQTGELDQARVYLEGSLEYWTKLMGPEHLNVGVMRLSLATLELESAHFERAIEHAESTLAIFEASVGPQHPYVAMPVNLLGKIARAQGRSADAMTYATRALQIREQALGSEHPELADGLDLLGQLEAERGNYERAREHHERALKIKEAALGPEDLELAKSWMFLGKLAEATNKPDVAREWFERAVALATKHPDDASFLADAESALARVSSSR